MLRVASASRRDLIAYRLCCATIEADAPPTLDSNLASNGSTVAGTRSTTFIGSLNLLARAGDRVLSFVQIVLVAAVFGATPKADLYFLASIVPLTIALVVGDPLGRGMLSALARERDRESGVRLAAAGLVAATALLVALTVAYDVIAVVAVKLTTPSGSGGLGPWLGFSPIIIFAGLVGYLSGLLLWTHRYGWAAFLNPVATAVGLGLMGVAVWQSDRLGLVALAVSAGYGAAMLIAFVAVRRRLGAGWFRTPRREDLRAAFDVPRRVLSPAVGQVLGGQAIVALERALALTLGVGAVSTLSYARGISAAPVFIAQGIAGGIYPGLVRAEALRESRYLRDSFLAALRTTLFVGSSFALYFAFFGPSVGAALLQRGALSTAEALHVGHILIAFAPSTAATSLLIVLVSVLFGIGEFHGVLERSVVAFCAYLVAAPVLMVFFGSWGLAFGYSLALGVAAVFATVLVGRKLDLSARALIVTVGLPASLLIAPVAATLAGYRLLLVAAGPHISVAWRGVVFTGTSFLLLVIIASFVFVIAPLPESRRVRRLLDRRTT